MKLKPSSFHHNNNSNSSKENLDMLLQDKLISSREEFEEKSNYLVNIYERSQALELAKLVNNEEMKIPDDTPAPGSEDYEKAQKLAVELTLLRVGRRTLISSIIAFTGGVTSFANGGAAGFAELLDGYDSDDVLKLIEDSDQADNAKAKAKAKAKSDVANSNADSSNTANTTAAATTSTTDIKEEKDVTMSNSNSNTNTPTKSKSKSTTTTTSSETEADKDNIATLKQLKKEQFAERKTQAKLYLYKKLISNICDLPVEEIDQELLNGIESRLMEGASSGSADSAGGEADCGAGGDNRVDVDVNVDVKGEKEKGGIESNVGVCAVTPLA
ncbi:unnamed protein product [Ambrosiozyma monospora]|uniref:Unnamed protein product n=1 Tax=Ambrosiozyma monospora TaxID=43982 RepID=A0ACB5SXW0_AMBMO|nr:unnamed protein product [Ambrosiozyma monospora]